MDEKKPAAPVEPKAPAPVSKPAVYASAAASEDPSVQHILGERQIHVMNGDMDLADQCDKRLNALGYC